MHTVECISIQILSALIVLLSRPVLYFFSTFSFSLYITKEVPDLGFAQYNLSLLDARDAELAQYDVSTVALQVGFSSL